MTSPWIFAIWGAVLSILNGIWEDLFKKNERFEQKGKLVSYPAVEVVSGFLARFILVGIGVGGDKFRLPFNLPSPWLFAIGGAVFGLIYGIYEAFFEDKTRD